MKSTFLLFLMGLASSAHAQVPGRSDPFENATPPSSRPRATQQIVPAPGSAPSRQNSQPATVPPPAPPAAARTADPPPSTFVPFVGTAAPAPAPDGSRTVANCTGNFQNMTSGQVVPMTAPHSRVICRFRFRGRDQRPVWNAAVTRSPRFGEVTISEQDGWSVFEYRPNVGYSGEDRFTISHGIDARILQFNVVVLQP